MHNGRQMNLLFVHGMGRTPLSALPLLLRLRRAGMRITVFGYFSSFESFETIQTRLTQRIDQLAHRGEFMVIGHSLGGVLLRATLATVKRQPAHVFLLGSPTKATRIAVYLRENWLFRLATGDCGQLLGSATRMAAVPPLTAPSTVIIGTRGLRGRLSPFANEANDGVIAVSEAEPLWPCERLELPVAHTFLPAHRWVAGIVLEHLAATH